MKSKNLKRYVAFLRGINVGGHHKVPMADLRAEMEKLNCENVVTILNSGNIIFDANSSHSEKLEKTISDHLEKVFGFPIPIIIRSTEMILGLLKNNPFKDEVLTKDLRFYISFLKKDVESDLQLPWTNEGGSFRILDKIDRVIISVLDVSVTKTPKAMENIEKIYPGDITTRNWNTIKRIEKKLE